MSDIFEDHRRWFKEYVSRIEQGIVKPPQPGVRYPCPSCGYPTLEERGGYDICPLCNWEDDGQDDPHADEAWGGPNSTYSLSEARNNFKRYLIMYDPPKPATGIGGNKNSLAEEQAKRAMVEAYDEMLNETNESVLDTLWKRVYENEMILRGELYRKVREYELRMKGKTGR